MNWTTTAVAGRAPSRKTRRRQQDFVGSLELPVLPLERFGPPSVGGRRPRLLTGVDRGLFAPAAQRVRDDPDPRAYPRTAAFNVRPGSWARASCTSRCARSRSSLGYFPRCWHLTTLSWLRARYQTGDGSASNSEQRSAEQRNGEPAAKAGSAPSDANTDGTAAASHTPEGTRIWTGHGILAHNPIKIAALAA